jgi:EmrB/QacA subfamily drug resistance transporter
MTATVGGPGAATTGGTGGELDRRQIITVFVGLMTGLLLSALDSNAVSTALPTIVGDLGGLEQVAWVGTAYLLASTAVTPLYGKLSDLHGRKPLFQVAIVLFVIGSLGCAVATEMWMLVLARGVQGLGGGGLLAMAFVIVGDVVPPRERGRYVGFFTSVFAFGSVAGPLMGGFFSDHFTWRWIFWINLPLGIAALVVTSRALRVEFVKHQRKIDILGATLLVASVTSLILATSWASRRDGWSAPSTVGLLAAAVGLAAVFIAWETRASEPIMPLRLFRNSIFTLVTIISVGVGSVMFGANYFLPLYLQIVQGASATSSGLLLLPLMAGVTVASITSGRLTSITGRYKVFPILGTGLAALGVFLISLMDHTTPRVATSATMLLIGLGIGMSMPTITLAVQNSVDWRDMGTATGLTTFFRTLGGAVGVAVYGALLNARLDVHLADELPAGTAIDKDVLLQSPKAIRSLEPIAVREGVIRAVADAVTDIFTVATPVLVVCFVAAWFVKELPLRSTSSLQEARPVAAHE